MPQEPAKRSRTVWPIQICRVEGGALRPIKDGPTFSDQREAYAWIEVNGKPGETYAPARIGRAVRLTLALEEVAL